MTASVLRFQASDGNVFDKSNDTVVVTRSLLTSAADEIERLTAAHEDIVRKYERVMGEPPDWTAFKGDQLTWVREAWYGAANISRKALAYEQSQG